MIVFDSDSSHSCLYSCVAGVLAGFNSDFIEVSHAGTNERSSYVTTIKSTMIGESIATCTLNDDTGDICTLKTHVTHAPSSKHCIMSPQWLGIQERK